MTKGIVLLAFGKRGYGFAAYNLAVSIRAYNKTIPITLFYDNQAFNQVEESKMGIFDQRIPLKEEQFYKDGRFDPAWMKINMYELLPYDLNLYLDVDALCLKDVAPLFEKIEKEKKNFFYTHIIGTHTIDKGRDFAAMQWAWADDIWKHFKLSAEDVFYATNSSYQVIRKGAKAKKFFEHIRKNYENPIPVDKLRMKWGGWQPDELYMNASLCQLKVQAEMDIDVMFFGGDLRHNFTEIEEKFYFLSLYGAGFHNVSTTRSKYREWYDRRLFKHFKERGEGHIYKVQYIMQDKHANIRK